MSQSAQHPAGQAEFIESLGGPAHVARLLSRALGQRIAPNTVGTWKARGVPWRSRQLLVALAKAKGADVPAGFLGDDVPADAFADVA